MYKAAQVVLICIETMYILMWPVPQSYFNLVWLSWGSLAALSLTLVILDEQYHEAG